jgi:hypothetical protein
MGTSAGITSAPDFLEINIFVSVRCFLLRFLLTVPTRFPVWLLTLKVWTLRKPYACATQKFHPRLQVETARTYVQPL